MQSYVIKILNYFLLFTTGIALIGVNVTQLSCCHSKDLQWEVQIVPVDRDCPCAGDCCPQGCHEQARHDFYKITDLSRIEQNVYLEISQYIPEDPLQLLPQLSYCQEERYSFHQGIPDIYFPRELLCIYLC